MAGAKQRIREVYLELLAKYPDASFTVTEIAQRANVNRVTVYRLFETKDTILESILDEFGKGISEDLGGTDNDDYQDTRDVLEHHRQNMPALRTILNSVMAPVLEARMEEGTRKPLIRAVEEGFVDKDRFDEMFLSFYAAGMSRVICNWIRGGCKESIDELMRFSTVREQAWGCRAVSTARNSSGRFRCRRRCRKGALR